MFNFPNGQRLQNGWPVSFTQPAGSASDVASNADWNQSIGSGGSFTAGFNGTFSGTNNAPTAFTLNGTACNGGTTPPTNTPPTVSLTSPTSGQQIANGATIPLAATASDNGSVSRVEFRVDGTLVSTDTSSPYSFTNPALAAGSHTAQATAFDNAIAAAVDFHGADSVHGAGRHFAAYHRRESGDAEPREWRHRHVERPAVGRRPRATWW